MPATGKPRKSEWYADGLRFECTQCGNCCTGGPGYVAVSEPEGRAIAAVLGVGYDDFLRMYTRKEGMGRSLREVMTERGHDCVFLDFDTEGRAICKVYQARPLQCRTFPWWPENLKTEASWKRLAHSCPGIDRGNFVPVQQIRIQRDAQAADPGVTEHGPSR